MRARAEALLNPEIVIVATLAIVGCGVDSPESQAPIVVQPARDCQMGDVCTLRPPRKSAIAATSLKAYTRFLRFQAANDTDSIGSMLGKGEIVILLARVQIRVIKLRKDGVEAIVVKDDWHPAADGLGWTGLKIAGQKVWLENALWVAAAGQ